MIIILIVVGSVATYAVTQNNNNSSVAVYARQKGITDAAVQKIHSCDTDRFLGVEEKAIIDYASKLDNASQIKVIDSFLSDGVISPEEMQQLHFLGSIPQAEQIQIIQSGNVNNSDPESDKMSSNFEQNVAHTPYNVHNGRYAILIEPDKDGRQMSDMQKFLVNEQKFQPQNVILLEYTNATIENFKKAVSELSCKVSENDIVLVGMNGEGINGSFCFNDGKGNFVGGSKPMSYKDIDSALDSIKPMKMLVTVSACQAETAIEPLKEAPSPRVVAHIEPNWLYRISKNYLALDRGPPRKLFDLDENGYVSIDETIKVATEYQTGAPSVDVADLGNIAPDFYLGEFKVQD